MAKQWVCLVCGYVHDGDGPPDECPLCAAGPDEFEELADLCEGIRKIEVALGQEKQVLSLPTIKDRVAAVIRRSPEKPVLVWGDRAVPYGDVVTVMVALQEAGAPSIGLVTENPQ